jgi:hypothetical protein
LTPAPNQSIKPYKIVKIEVLETKNVGGNNGAIYGHAGDQIRPKSNYRQEKAHLDERQR